MSDYSAWIDRVQTHRDRIEPAALARWLATLDREAGPGDEAPQGYHWCVCLPETPTSGLGPDGHPIRDESPDSFLPPVPQPRRMWAGSRVEFVRPLLRGQPVERRSRVASISAKQGASGALVFVDVEHETRGGGDLSVREVQSLVYREPAPEGTGLVPPIVGEERFDPQGWDAHRVVTPSEPLLFRYSALTFNGHRIHYDLAYATGEEGYRGLVVHGPLTATLLLDLARREFGENRLKTFAFRGTSPAICGDTLHLVMRRNESGLELGAFASDGRQVMSASATT